MLTILMTKSLSEKDFNTFVAKEYQKKIQTCPNCGKPMKQAFDKRAKKKTGYLWECDCSKGLKVSVG